MPDIFRNGDARAVRLRRQATGRRYKIKGLVKLTNSFQTIFLVIAAVPCIFDMWRDLPARHLNP